MLNRRIISHPNNQVARGKSPQVSNFLVQVYLLLTTLELHMSEMANLKECVREYDDSVPKNIQSKYNGFQIHLQLPSP